MMAGGLVAECELDVEVPPSGDPCMDAIMLFSSIDSSCPRDCNGDEGKEDGLPICEVGQSEHSAASCGTDACASAVTSVIAGMDGMMAGFAACEGLGF